jgi:predicted dehydrogenase
VTGARVIGVASRSLEKGMQFARAHDLSIVARSAAELAARAEIDVVCIATPSGAHLEPAHDAIRAGKHVVVEKPLETTLARVDTMLEAADRAGVRVAPIFQGRFGPGATAVRAAVSSGRLGRLVLASAAVKWHRSRQYYSGWKGTLGLDGGGAVINQAIHGLDLLVWFAGLPAQVHAWTGRRVHTAIEAEDTACASLLFADGAMGVFEGTTAAWPGWSRRIELCGESGSIALEDDRITRWDFNPPQPRDSAMIAAGVTADSGAASPAGIAIDNHVRQFQDIVDSLLHSRLFAVESGDARRAVALVNALYDSAARGAPVSLS